MALRSYIDQMRINRVQRRVENGVSFATPKGVHPVDAFLRHLEDFFFFKPHMENNTINERE